MKNHCRSCSTYSTYKDAIMFPEFLLNVLYHCFSACVILIQSDGYSFAYMRICSHQNHDVLFPDMESVNPWISRVLGHKILLWYLLLIVGIVRQKILEFEFQQWCHGRDLYTRYRHFKDSWIDMHWARNFILPTSNDMLLIRYYDGWNDHTEITSCDQIEYCHVIIWILVCNKNNL